jgi:hypothetical protein
MEPLVESVLEAWMWSAVIAFPFMAFVFRVQRLFNRVGHALMRARGSSGACRATIGEERKDIVNAEVTELPCQRWTPQEISELWDEFYSSMCEEELDNLSDYSPR